MARKAEVSAGSVTGFFNKRFGGPEKSKGHSKYKAVCRDKDMLLASLKLLNGEFSPHMLYGRNPSGEGATDEDD